jgi:hypothetical protein
VREKGGSTIVRSLNDWDEEWRDGRWEQRLISPSSLIGRVSRQSAAKYGEAPHVHAGLRGYLEDMPVYLGTSHAYRSWDEDHPKGYMQRDEGLKPPSEGLQRWRSEHAKHEPMKFTVDQQRLLHEVVVMISEERLVRLHASATVTTHVHKLFSFRSPACTCGASEFCAPGCAGRQLAERFMTRVKQKMGQQLAKQADTSGRPWFSRGWDLTPVRDRAHFDHLIETYLPDHERFQGGIFRKYP